MLVTAGVNIIHQNIPQFHDLPAVIFTGLPVCRAVGIISGQAKALSRDFTPERERRRLQQLAEQQPQLLGNEFCSRQFVQRVTSKDLGTEVLYRDSRMEGW